MNHLQQRVAATCILFIGFFIAYRTAPAVTIETVPIRNAGNPADTRYLDSYHPNGVGAVAYPFEIGKTEVTNAQYLAFLSAVAAADPYELYHTAMSYDTRGGIVRSGASGSYTYAIKAAALSDTYTYHDKPVVFVSSGDAMRFANWLHNGQPTGPQDASTTEDGAYMLNGVIDDALAAVTRNAGARWWLPNENEWYKAAYHKNDGVFGNYWDYPAGTNSVPNNNGPSSDTGNSANFGITTGNSSYPLTKAGAYTLSDSPYGTFDQAGNVSEWNETLFDSSFRGIRGGGWDGSSIDLHASHWYDFDAPFHENGGIGFRVASIPEPTGLTLCLAGAMALMLRRIRR
jgi:formylglycine-generating enzyme required for sulfatase activity